MASLAKFQMHFRAPAKATANWSELPNDVLLLIGENLETHFEVLHFRSVCAAWRASVPLNLRPRPAICFPFRGISGESSLLYKRSFCLFKFPADLNRSTPRYWLVMLMENLIGRKLIIDPLFCRKLTPVQSPMVLDISKLHVQELGFQYASQSSTVHSNDYDTIACLSVNPNHEDNFYLLQREEEEEEEFYSLFNTGDEDEDEDEEEYIKIGFEDFDSPENFIQFKRKFYAVDNFGTTICIEPGSGSKSLVSEAFTFRGGKNWLVESSCGNLLLVEWISEWKFDDSGFSLGEVVLRVYELEEEKKKWIHLGSLGDRIMFLGNECRFCAGMIPGVEGNCVVYALGKKGYVYHLGSGKTVPLLDRPDLLQLFRHDAHFY